MHAVNQFMFCLEGHYEYTRTGVTLKPGSFYWNPKGNVHGPTIAREDTVVVENSTKPTKEALGMALWREPESLTSLQPKLLALSQHSRRDQGSRLPERRRLSESFPTPGNVCPTAPPKRSASAGQDGPAGGSGPACTAAPETCTTADRRVG